MSVAWSKTEEGRRYHREYNRRRREADLAKARTYEREYARSVAPYRAAYKKRLATTLEGRAYRLWDGARQRASRGKFEFSLSVDHVMAGLKRGICPRTGFFFDMSLANKGKTSPFAPSLDKIDSAQGYSDTNVQVVCWQYNLMKHLLTEEQLLHFCKSVARAAECR